MNGPVELAKALNGARVLVLGRSREVLETVLADLADLGITAEGSTEPETAADRYDAARFDLITFGGGLRGPLEDGLKRVFRQQSPDVRFLDVFAPQAVSQIVAAYEVPAGPPVDLDAYCERIGYRGRLEPTLATLKELHRLHPAAIPFENLDVLLGRGVELAPAVVDRKLVGGGRGGYCYEHNSLFKRVLTTIGFPVEGRVARVRWRAPPGAAPRPPTHMALCVTVEGRPWLADVGFGGWVSTSPLRMDISGPQSTEHGAFRLFPFGTGLLVQAKMDGRWLSLYELSQQAQLDVDYELPNWYAATHPSSLFRHNLIVSRATPEARYALLNSRLTVRSPQGGTRRRQLDVPELESVLEKTFELRLEGAWRGVLEAATRSPT